MWKHNNIKEHQTSIINFCVDKKLKIKTTILILNICIAATYTATNRIIFPAYICALSAIISACSSYILYESFKISTQVATDHIHCTLHQKTIDTASFPCSVLMDLCSYSKLPTDCNAVPKRQLQEPKCKCRMDQKNRLYQISREKAGVKVTVANKITQFCSR